MEDEQNEVSGGNKPQDTLNIPVRIEIPRSRHEWVISGCIAIIALCALGVSIWQGFLIRKYNLLAVKPMLMAEIDLSKEAKTPGLFLSNEGLGPAIVRNAAIYDNGKLIGPLNTDDWVSFAHLEHFSFPNEHVPTDLGGLSPNQIVQINYDGFLFALRKNPPSDALTKLDDILHHHLGIWVCYCSLYNQCQTLIFKDGNSRDIKKECSDQPAPKSL